jgi:hypothetical protein
MRQSVTCTHPELRPTDWNQPKPEDWHGFTCECGQNWCCPVCGYGQGAMLCGCTRKITIDYSLDKSLVENAHIWRWMAEA